MNKTIKYFVLFIGILNFVLLPKAYAEEEIVCIDCHLSLEIPLYTKIVEDWKGSIHKEMGIKCNDCHGGDPNDYFMAMDESTGYVGKPETKDIPKFCGKCHVGIYENFRSSAHQKALNEGKGPTCVTCHNNHAVKKVTSNLISEENCGTSECHDYERPQKIKQAFSSAEFEIQRIQDALPPLDKDHIKTKDVKERLFSAQQSLHSMTHELALDKIRDKTTETMGELTEIQKDVDSLVEKFDQRRLIGFFVLVFLVAGLGILLRYRVILREYRKKEEKKKGKKS